MEHLESDLNTLYILFLDIQYYLFLLKKVNFMGTISTFYPSKFIHDWFSENSDYKSEAKFNMDMSPLQNPILRNNWTDVMNPIHRERVYQYSPYLRQVTIEPLLELVDNGWEYVSNDEFKDDESENKNPMDTDKPTTKPTDKPMNTDKPSTKPTEEKEWLHREGLIDSFTEYSQIPEWSDDLGYKSADATALGMSVDTAFMLIMRDALYEDEWQFIPISRNYLYNNRAVGNGNRQISKIEIVFPNLSDLTDEHGLPFEETTETFYTQYADRTKEIDAVVIQPVRSQESPFGRPYVLRELQTAYEKLYLRFYELLYLHKGGVYSESYALPNNVSDTLITQTKKEMTRGMLGHGYVITLPKTIKLNDSFQHNAVPMQKLDTAFDRISTHINEDSILSKSKVGGDTGSGFAGLQPVQSSADDEKVTKKMGLIYEKVIKDINYVLYGVDPRSYRVKFNESENLMNQFNETNQDIRDEESRLGRKIEYVGRGDAKSIAKANGKGTGEQTRK